MGAGGRCGIVRPAPNGGCQGCTHHSQQLEQEAAPARWTGYALTGTPTNPPQQPPHPHPHPHPPEHTLVHTHTCTLLSACDPCRPLVTACCPTTNDFGHSAGTPGMSAGPAVGEMMSLNELTGCLPLSASTTGTVQCKRPSPKAFAQGAAQGARSRGGGGHSSMLQHAAEAAPPALRLGVSPCRP